MYQEYRELTTTDTIIKVEEIAASKCHWPAVKQFHNSKIKFPLAHHILHHQYKPGFTTKRPNTVF
ncbi:60S ribosomal protein L18A [Saguinus oedipus]|uniref:60S ribosomal protein L18A n=1 Tax=Saguinus oedipus TaxID=9490 RepID=A0ABQ9UH46_SAGOE|nr:60S ribosomal protein L18A [Saguinus oedipus]